MLVLSRRKNESIVIPGLGINVSVISIDGQRIKLGFEAPDDVKILRSELHEADQLAAQALRPVPLAPPSRNGTANGEARREQTLRRPK